MSKQIRFVFILFFLCLANSYAQEKDTIAPLDFSHIKDTTTYHDKVDELRKIVRTGSGTVSIKEIDRFIQLGVDLDYSKGLGKANVVKATIYRNRLEHSLAEKYYKKAIVYFKEIDYQMAIAIVHNELYMSERRIGNLEKSVYYLLEAKNYFEKRQDSVPLIAMYNNLGQVHMELKDYKFSEESYSKSIALIKKTGRYQSALGKIMNNLALVYLKDRKFDAAESIASESLEINKKDSVPSALSYSYSTLGEISLAKKEYAKARKFYDTTLYYDRLREEDITIVDTEQRVAYIELQLGNINKAKSILAETRKVYTKVDARKELLINYEMSSKLDSTRGDLAGALSWQYKYQALSDKMAADLSTKKIEKREEFYEAELEQLRTIDQQEIREERNKEQLFRYRIFTFVILGVLTISLVFVFWIIKTRKERKKLITKLNESNQVKNKLFSIISHDLKNEIHGLEGSLNLIQDNELSTEEFEEIVPLLADRTNQTSILLNNLLNWSKSQLKELSSKPVNFDVSELISNKFIFFKPKANQKNIKLINLLNSTNVYADKDMIGIVAQNLIANAIKFCKPGDSISLLSREKDEYYEIGFADTGIGIDPANINKLFAEETFTTNGTQNESGTGLGLRICKELIALNKGTIRVESKLGEGTTFYISLPKVAK